MEVKRKWLRYLLGAALAGILVLLAQALIAQETTHWYAAQTTPAGPEEPQQNTFLGTIGRSHGDLVLKGGYASQNPKAKTNYKLDFQEKVKPYEGKSVKITGALDASTNTIHVSTIKPTS